MDDNSLLAKTALPPNYVSATPSPAQPPIPTPPDQAYSPSSILRTPMPGLTTDPDQQRQFYGRGTIVRRYWPYAASTNLQ